MSRPERLLTISPTMHGDTFDAAPDAVEVPNAPPQPRARKPGARKLTPTERANRARATGRPGTYEIWFLVIFEPGTRRATWLRFTTFTPVAGRREPARSLIWAATFDAEAASPARAVKALHDPHAFKTRPDGFHIQIADAELGEGYCRGAVDGEHLRLAWDLAFVPAKRPSNRLPRLLAALPLPVRSAHVHTETTFSGELVVDGVRRRLEDAVGVQMHIVGKRRVDEIRWVYAPELVDPTTGARATCEATAVRLKRKVAGLETPWVTGVHLGGAHPLELATLMPSGKVRVSQPRDLLVGLSAQRATRRVCLRSWASPERFVGYRYRDPRRGDSAVAQSDIADAYVEVFDRAHPLARWRPAAQLVARRTAALELHGPDPIDGLAYVAWDAREATQPARRAPADRPPDRAALGGELVPLPSPGAIHALGLTYAGHLRETGESLPPVSFDKDLASWWPAEDEVAVPQSEALLAALERLEPGLAASLRARFRFLPALMDYEVELGVMLLEDLDPAALDDARAPIRLGYFVANDLTARSVQLLGEGRADRLRYWSLAKSFPGFLPVTRHLWIPADTTAASFPELELTTRVNGEVRQRASTRELLLSPREVLRHTAAVTGRMPRRGDVILSGTPAGVALRVPRWKRRLADRLLDRFGKLAAAIHGHARGVGFLLPGDRVEVDGGPLGARTVTLALG